jgi:hypothetical protein
MTGTAIDSTAPWVGAAGTRAGDVEAFK